MYSCVKTSIREKPRKNSEKKNETIDTRNSH